MSSSEYKGWQKYLALEPFGGENIQLALLALVTSSAYGGKGKLDDYLITLHKNNNNKIDKNPITSSQIKSMFSSIVKPKEV